MKGTVATTKIPEKYPFFDTFVSAMDSINAPEKVTDQTDLKVLLLFFKLYVLGCQSLHSRKMELTKKNIKQEMTTAFDFIRSDGVAKYVNGDRFLRLEN